MKAVVVVPALDEAGNIGPLVAALRRQAVDEIIVADNGSTDRTAVEAAEAGALVVDAPSRGYGHACAAGSGTAIAMGAELIVFIDGDGSSRPDELSRLTGPIERGEADLVLGSRVLGTIRRGAMAPHQRFGNWLSARLMSRLYRQRFTDLGPYRAIRADLLATIDMTEMTFGWPTEMTVKAAALGRPVTEVPVTWEPRREGSSKVSGTVRGSVSAAWQITSVAIRHRPGGRPDGSAARE